MNIVQEVVDTFINNIYIYIIYNEYTKIYNIFILDI